MRKKRGRAVTGILLLDKPAGLTSNHALQKLKRLYGARKAGHTGSLDPLATGLLPLCFGDATKVSGFLLDADKSYEVTCRLGVATDTADAEGEVIEEAPVPAFSDDDLERACAGLRGEIEQLPPMYSAIKHQGRRLYDLAREGVEVERTPRPVTLYKLEAERVDAETLQLHVHCSKGTYVRTLAEDLARGLGTVAHVTGLRRTALGPYTDPAMWTLEQLEALGEDGTGALDDALLPMDSALVGYEALNLADDLAWFLVQGQPIFVPRAPAHGWVRLYQGGERFLGMGQILDDGRVAPKRLIAQRSR